MTHKNFFSPLNLKTIYDRVIPGDNSLVWAALAIFAVAYTFDEALGMLLGLDQYTIAGFAGLTVVCSMVFVAVRDFFFRRWDIFYLKSGEVILATRDDKPFLITETEQIRAGALRGCKRPLLIDTRPWINHRIECLTAAVQTTLAVTLSVDASNPDTLVHWINTSESDVTSEIRAVATQVAHRLGRGVVLESPDRFKVAVEYEVNSRFLASLGVTCRITVMTMTDRAEVGVPQR